MKRTITCLLAVLVMPTITPVAHADPPSLPQLTLSSVAGTTGTSMGEPLRLEQAYQDAQTARPRRGVIITSVLLAGSAGLLASGIAISRICFSSSPCPNGPGVGAASVGAALMVGSIVGLTISSVRLKRAKEGSLRRHRRALP